MRNFKMFYLMGKAEELEIINAGSGTAAYRILVKIIQQKYRHLRGFKFLRCTME